MPFLISFNVCMSSLTYIKFQIKSKLPWFKWTLWNRVQSISGWGSYCFRSWITLSFFSYGLSRHLKDILSDPKYPKWWFENPKHVYYLKAGIFCVPGHVPWTRTVWYKCSIAFCWVEMAIWCWGKNFVSGFEPTSVKSLALPLGHPGQIISRPRASFPHVERAVWTNRDSMHEALSTELGTYWVLREWPFPF